MLPFLLVPLAINSFTLIPIYFPIFLKSFFRLLGNSLCVLKLKLFLLTKDCVETTGEAEVAVWLVLVALTVSSFRVL